MGDRTKHKQTQHNKKIRALAAEYADSGWKVQADLQGFDRPEGIGKHGMVPDLVVSKSGNTRIIEVETAETMATDKKQHAVFRRSAMSRKRTKFFVEEA